MEEGAQEPRNECGWPPGAGKGKGTDSSLEPPEEISVLLTIQFYPSDICQTLLYKTVR
jgi:hypothetical protein